MMKSIKLGILIGLILLANDACSSFPTVYKEPGVTIVKESTAKTRFRKGFFWSHPDGVQLYGEIVSRPSSKRAIPGHIDVNIESPDQTSTLCRTTKQRQVAGKKYSRFSLLFDKLPVKGSYVVIKYHNANIHGVCVA